VDEDGGRALSNGLFNGSEFRGPAGRAAAHSARRWSGPSTYRGPVRLLVRLFLRVAFRCYFRRVHVRDVGLVPGEGPLLLVANHPNSLVDPALLIHILDRPIHFGARHGLFQTPLGPVLRMLGAIPLVRAQDDARGMRQNLRSIATYVELLEAGRATAIFPEGLSQDSPQLAPVKNGAARIALEAESRKDFGMGLRIVPVGLQFEPRRRFRGDAFVRFGKPFGIEDLAGLHRDQPRQAMREVTSRIETSLAELAIHVESLERAWMVDRLSEVYLQRVRKTGLLGTGKEGLEGELRYRMAACLNYFARTDLTVVQDVERCLRRYDRLRSAAGVESRLVEERAYLLPGPLAPVQAGVELGLGLVPAIAGAVTAGLPYLVTRSGARYLAARQKHPPSLSLLHILIGAVAFPLTWGLELLLASTFLTLRQLAVLALLLPPLGVFALAFARRTRKLAVHVSGRMTSWMKLDEIARVREAQVDLLTLMDRVRRRYQEEVFGVDSRV
jgi:glycerol-3-phosphate O-acyltransferase/dihydroxyacetone phosphate acyltransferase